MGGGATWGDCSDLSVHLSLYLCLSVSLSLYIYISVPLCVCFCLSLSLSLCLSLCLSPSALFLLFFCTHSQVLNFILMMAITWCVCVCVDKVDDDLEMTMVCHRPEGLDKLEAQTNFSKRELQVLYRGFKNVSAHTHPPSPHTPSLPLLTPALFLSTSCCLALHASPVTDLPCLSPLSRPEEHTSELQSR